MKSTLKFLAILWILNLFVSNDGLAQGQSNYWYFGYNAGIRFSDGPIALSDGMVNSLEGCATISDEDGNLMFYTDGSTVYDANHDIMQNGTGLLGDYSSTQSGIIVQKPGSSTEFYIFTVPAYNNIDGLCYSIVDMTLNGGLGAVTAEKNINLVESTAEKVTAVYHSNGMDFWVITHLANSDAYHAYLVTASGVNFTPVVSNIGASPASTGESLGYLKVTPTTGKIAAIHSYLNIVEVSDFNYTTGEVTNLITVPLNSGGTPYGLEFSPNQRFLYTSTYGSGTNNIVQIDLEAGSDTDVINSASVVCNAYVNMGAIQIAPDNKLYFACTSDYLGVIEEPDLQGVACQAEAECFYLNGNSSAYGLPTFFSSFFVVPEPDIIESCQDDTVFFQVDLNIIVDSVIWNFDDPQSMDNSSTDLYTYHIYNESGTYNPFYVAYFDDDSVTVDFNVSINPEIVFELGVDTFLCEGETYLLDATYPESEYLWQDNSTDAQYLVQKPGTYFVAVSNSCETAYDTIEVGFHEISVDFNTIEYKCETDTVFLDAYNTDAEYLWSTNDTISEIYVTNPGEYTVEISLHDCNKTYNVIVDNILEPEIELGNDTSICEGGSVQLSPNTNGYDLEWSNGSQNQYITVNVEGEYSVTASNECGSDYDSIFVTVNTLPELQIEDNFIMCNNSPITIYSGSDESITWFNSLGNEIGNADSIIVENEGTYQVQAVNEFNCNTMVEFFVENSSVEPDLGADEEIYETDSITLETQLSYSTYLWNTGETTSSVQIIGNDLELGTHEYYVQVTNEDNCSGSDTILITIIEDNSVFEIGQHEFKIYPNPIKSTLFIESSALIDYHVDVYSITGNYIEGINLTGSSHISMEFYNDGTYLLRINYKGKVVNVPVVIAK
jgi:hypothetical protein